jgi:hypothetical protein
MSGSDGRNGFDGSLGKGGSIGFDSSFESGRGCADFYGSAGGAFVVS